MNIAIHIVCRALAALLCLALPLFSMAAEDYRIEQVKNNVYRFSFAHYHSAFMVTSAGILVTDPINDKAAAWLKAELARRFDAPVLYLVYSHNHLDHVTGGQVFAEAGAAIVAHEDAAADLRMTKAPTALPDVTFSDQLALNLGDSRVLLEYHGANNGRGSVSMRFMPANVLYVVDWIVLGRMAYRDLPGYDIHGSIRSVREVLNRKPFDRFIGGHGETGSYQDVEHYLGYLEALYSAVRDGMLAGKDLATLQADIRLPEYKNLLMYEEWLPLNIQGMYDEFIDMAYFHRREGVKARQ
jgi:glyoxylase-like metal-dependent hydrolase (beta-lactamase superfamily II)